MAPIETWEQVLVGAIALLAIFFFFPGIKATFKKSREAKSDWTGLLIPIALVVLFVLFLISVV